MQISSESKRTQNVIRQLKKRIKDLQWEVCQRTRSYLLHKGVKAYMLKKQIHQQVQTQIYQIQHPPFQYLTHPSPFQSAQRPHNITSLQAYQEPKFNIQNFQIGPQSSPERKAEIERILQQWIDQEATQQKNGQMDSVNETFISQSSQKSHGEMDRQKRRMRRQIKKLNAKLEFQRKIIMYAKEGLLISEEQNYKFRLQIKQLQRSQHLQISALKEDQTKLHEELEHQRLMKEQYLQNCIFLSGQNKQLQEEIHLLKEALENKKEQSKLIVQNDKSQFSLTDDKIWQQIKNVSYSISNCIPITAQCTNVNFFKPQNAFQILQTLQRVEQYCKQIQQRQQQKNNTIHQQRQLFTDLLVKISRKINQATKKQIEQETSAIPKLNPFTKLLTKAAQPPNLQMISISENTN